MYEDGKPVGTPLNYDNVAAVTVADFDGERVLMSDRTTTADGTLLLYTFADGHMQRVPSGSALNGGAVYSSVRNGTTSTWSIRRTDLAIPQRNRSRSRGMTSSDARPSPLTSTPRTRAAGTRFAFPSTSSAAPAISSATAICVVRSS